MLTEIACRNARAQPKAQKLADSLGLYLFVTPAGFKSWRLKYRVGKTEKRLVLGAYPEMTLKEAREQRDAARKQLRDGLDPSIERKKRKASRAAGSAQTLQRFAEDWHAARKPGWREHYATAVLNRLKLDVFPTLGPIPIGEVTAPMVLTTLQRIEKRGALDVARRVRQHLSDVFRVAIAVGAAKYDPTAGLDRALKARVRGRRPAVQTIEEARRVLASVEAVNVEPTTRLASRLIATANMGERPRFLRIPDVMRETGLSRTTIYRLEKAGDFPHRVKLSGNSMGWWAPDIDQWASSRRAHSSG